MDSPKIPTLKDSQNPKVKLRGIGAGATLFERMKQFKKKDLAFILAGLGTLLMAPLAEHFMMAPESGDSALNAGFGKGGSGIFPGNGSSPYEPGTSGFAPGSAIGGGSDVITPLNVRDPSSLVMGPGSTQQPPAGSAVPGTAPATAPRSDNDFKDALASSARSVGAAAKGARGLIPMPKVSIAGSGLRGLGVASGSSGGPSATLGPISASGPSRPNVGGGLAGVRALPGYHGVARGQGQGGSGYDNLKRAADAAGERLNQGRASSALNDAANQGIPTGGSAFGGNGAGGTSANDKGFGGNNDRGSKNIGESLEFLKQKRIQEKQIDLWGKEREENDMFLQLAKLRNTMLNTIAGEVAKSVGACSGKLAVGDPCKEPDKGFLGVKCWEGDKWLDFPKAKIGACDGKDGSVLQKISGVYYECGQGIRKPLNCSEYGGENKASATGNNQGSVPDARGGVPGSDVSPNQILTGPNLNGLGKQCADLKKDYIDDPTKAQSSESIKKANTYIREVYKEARALVVIRDALKADAQTNDCGDEVVLGPEKPSLKRENQSIQTSLDAIRDLTVGSTPEDEKSVIAQIKKAAQADPEKEVPKELPGSKDLNTAKDQMKKTKALIEAADSLYKGLSKAHATDVSKALDGSSAQKSAAPIKNAVEQAYANAGTAIKSANDYYGTLEVAHRSLDLVVVKGDPGNPTLGDVLQNKINLKAQEAIAKGLKVDPAGEAKPAAAQDGVPSVEKTRAAIAKANVALTEKGENFPISPYKDLVVRKGFEPALEDLKKQEQVVSAAAKANVQTETARYTAMKSKVSTIYTDTRSAMLTAVQTQSQWLDEIRKKAGPAK